MKLYVDFISNDRYAYAYTADLTCILRNVNSINADFKKEIDIGILLGNETSYITHVGEYLVLLRVNNTDRNRCIMPFFNYKREYDRDKTIIEYSAYASVELFEKLYDLGVMLRLGIGNSDESVILTSDVSK